MAMIESLKARSRRLIARHRQHASVRTLHRLATFIEDSYENEEWDMCVNGEMALIRRLAPAGFTVAFDVGAHSGDWSVEALRDWPRAHVHAFEVAEPTFERLTRQVRAAGVADRMTLNNVGLGEAVDARQMYYFPEHPHLTCDLPRHYYASTTFVAQLVDGDTYIEQHGIDAVDFAKIDVEGAEHLVLKGLKRTIEAGRLHCLQFEYGAFSIQTRVLLADYYERLAPDYWIGKIFPSGVEFADYHFTMENFRFSNFLCVARTRPDLKALAEARVAKAS